MDTADPRLLIGRQGSFRGSMELAALCYEPGDSEDSTPPFPAPPAKGPCRRRADISLNECLGGELQFPPTAA